MAERNPTIMFTRIPGLVAASPKMLGALIVEHVDGSSSRLVAESGSPDLLPAGDAEFEGWRVANEYIQDQLSSLFASHSIDRSAYFPRMSEEDFRTNCAAMKLLLAVGRDRRRIRDCEAPPKYLASKAAIKSLDLSEILYRPVGVKISEGFKKYASSYDTNHTEKVLQEDFNLERDEEIEMDSEHFARPCDRCRLKAPAIICPIETAGRGNRFGEAEHFQC